MRVPFRHAIPTAVFYGAARHAGKKAYDMTKHPFWKQYNKNPVVKPKKRIDPFPSKPKKKKEDMPKEDMPVGASMKTIKFHTGLKPLKGMIKHHITYRDSAIYSVVWNGGFKTINTISYIGTTSQYLTGTSNTIGLNRDSVSYVEWFGLNPLQGVAVGNHINALNNPVSDKLGLAKSETYMDFKNSTNELVYIKVHVMCAQTDTNTQPLASYNAGITNDALYSTNYSTAANNAGLLTSTSGNEIAPAYSASSTSAVENLTVVTYTNIESKRLLRSVWKKLKTTSFELSAGDAYRLTILGSHNQFGLKERLSTLGLAYPKGCIAFLVECQGGIVLDNVNSSFIHGPGKVAVGVTRRIHLAPMKAPNSRFETTFVGAGTEIAGTTFANTKDVTLNTVAAVAGVLQ